MARYVSEFSLEKPYEEVFAAVSTKLKGFGYKETEYEYETVFKKGSGALSYPRFIKISRDGEKLRIEAWCKTPVMFGVMFGEKKPTKALQKNISDLEVLLLQSCCLNTAKGSIQKIAGDKKYPPVEKPLSRTTYTKNFLSKSVGKEYVIPSLIALVLAAICAGRGILADTVWHIYAFAAVAVLIVVMMIMKNTAVTAVTAVVYLAACVVIYIPSLDYFESMFEPERHFADRLADCGEALILVLLAVIWLFCAVALFITMSKTNKYYKKLSE